MTTSDNQHIDFTYTESNGVVRIKHSDADYDYIYGGSSFKAFMAVLPVIIISLVMIFGSFHVEDFFPVLESSEGAGSFLPRIILVAGCIMLLGSLPAFHMISDEEEEKRTDEVMSKNVRKYKQLHRE